MGTSLHLSNIQKEMLKLYSSDVKDEELEDIKKMIGFYFAQKATNEADKIWSEKNYSNDEMDKWLNEEE